MNREQKAAVVADVRHKLTNSQASFLVHYKGINVELMQSLRRSLRQNGGNFKVVKANLMRLAATDMPGMEQLAEHFKDQVAFVFADKDGIAVAKQLAAFAKGNASLRVISGVYDAQVVSKAQIEFLGSLPSREAIIAQALGTLQAPITSFVTLLNMMLVRLVVVLNQVAEKQKQA